MWPAIVDGGARVVSASSSGHRRSDIRWDDLQFSHGYDKWTSATCRAEEMVAFGWIGEQGNPLNPGFKTPEQGAATQVWAATSPQLSGEGGVFLEDCEVAELSTDDAPGVRPYAVDPVSAARLWTVSAELTGVNAFG